MTLSARLSLPLLIPGQAQKEFFHNEALQTLDILTSAAVEEAARNDPPESPIEGDCYIVGGSPTGVWSGKGQFIACYTSGGWRYVAPFEGMSAYVRATGLSATYRGGTWEFGALRGTNLMLGGVQVVGGRQAAIPAPTGGSLVDAEGRSTINQILTTLRQHGLIES